MYFVQIEKSIQFHLFVGELNIHHLNFDNPRLIFIAILETFEYPNYIIPVHTYCPVTVTLR